MFAEGKDTRTLFFADTFRCETWWAESFELTVYVLSNIRIRETLLIPGGKSANILILVEPTFFLWFTAEF